jgi:hypothetical protein
MLLVSSDGETIMLRKELHAHWSHYKEIKTCSLYIGKIFSARF